MSSYPNNTECNALYNSAANTGCQIGLGVFFTLMALIVISSSTKKDEYENLTTQVNELAMETEADNGEVIEDVEKM